MTNAPDNVNPMIPSQDSIRSARATHVHAMLTAERWSIRKAAMALGMNVSVLSTRMNGTTAFLADELEGIAGLLKMSPIDFYTEYIAVGPAGLEPTTSTV